MEQDTHPQELPLAVADTRTARSERLHEAIIDHLLLNPYATAEEVATQFRITKYQVNVIMRTDLFKAAYAARRQAVVEPIIAQNFKQKVEAIAEMGLDVLMAKLHRPPQMVKDNTAIQAVKLGMVAHGLETPRASVTIDLGKIAEALRSRGAPPATSDTTVVDV